MTSLVMLSMVHSRDGSSPAGPSTRQDEASETSTQNPDQTTLCAPLRQLHIQEQVHFALRSPVATTICA